MENVPETTGVFKVSFAYGISTFEPYIIVIQIFTYICNTIHCLLGMVACVWSQGHHMHFGALDLILAIFFNLSQTSLSNPFSWCRQAPSKIEDDMHFGETSDWQFFHLSQTSLAIHSVTWG